MRPRTSRTVRQAGPAVALVVLSLLTGCSSGSGSGSGDATTGPSAGTFTPSPGSWTGTDPAAGYHVVLLTTEQDDRTRVLSASVRSWAKDVEAELTEIGADRPEEYIARIQEAIDEDPELVITTGDGLVDPLALVTASNLDQQFLVIGAQLAEPTLNVTAAAWDGASYRGEGLGRHPSYDPATFTPERADRAVRAGVAATVTGLNGTVVWVN